MNGNIASFQTKLAENNVVTEGYEQFLTDFYGDIQNLQETLLRSPDGVSGRTETIEPVLQRILSSYYSVLDTQEMQAIETSSGVSQKLDKDLEVVQLILARTLYDALTNLKHRILAESEVRGDIMRTIKFMADLLFALVSKDLADEVEKMTDMNLKSIISDTVKLSEAEKKSPFNEIQSIEIRAAS